MYLLSQLWAYLAAAFATGALLGYWFWSWCRKRHGLAAGTSATAAAPASGIPDEFGDGDELAEWQSRAEQAERHAAAATRARDEAFATASNTAQSKTQSLLAEGARRYEAEIADLRSKADAAARQLIEFKAATAKAEAALADERRKQQAEVGTLKSHSDSAKKHEAEIAALQRKLDEAKRQADEVQRKHVEELRTAAVSRDAQLAGERHKRATEAASLESQSENAKMHEAQTADLRRQLDGARHNSGGAGVRPNLFYGPRDGQRDDLKLIGGVAAKYEQKLNALGIFHFDQIAAWTEKDITWFKNHLGEFDERVAKEKWIEQAAKLAAGWRPERDAGDAPKSAARPKAKKEPKDGPERLKSPRKGKADDLKLIWGVADELEKMLQALGIWHFEQIAKWTDTDEKWMTEKLGDATNRIGRDNWVAQAKKLAGGWRPASGIGEKPV